LHQRAAANASVLQAAGKWAPTVNREGRDCARSVTNSWDTSAAMSATQAITGDNGTNTVWVDSALPGDLLCVELAAQFGSVNY
jgi:hypothetical protein